MYLKYLVNDNAKPQKALQKSRKNTLPGAGKSLSLWRQRKIHCAGNFSCFSLHINHCLSSALCGDGEGRQNWLPWEKRWRPLLRCIPPALADLPRPQHVTDTSPRLLLWSGSKRPRTRRWAGCGASFSSPSTPDPLHPEGRLASASPGPPAPEPWPRATLGDPAAVPPHLSAGLAKPPDLLRSSRLREPPPGHPPARWRRRRRRLRSERAPPCTGQGGRRARRLTRGAEALGRREVPVSYRAARAGHPGSGRGAGGRSPGARPRGRAPPRGARGRPAPEPREEGTSGDGGGPQRPGLPGPRPAAGCARSLPDQRRAGPYHYSEGGRPARWNLRATCPPAPHRHPLGQVRGKPRVLQTRWGRAA